MTIATDELAHAEIEAAAIIAYAKLQCDVPGLELNEADRAVFEVGFASGVEFMLRRIKAAI